MLNVKPGCDVETLEDFARYYEGSYMESRDGRVLKVTGCHGKNLVLLDHAQRHNKTEGYVFLPWSEVQEALVYGRPSGSLLKVDGKVYMIHVPNNRMAGRGFKPEYYRYTCLRRGNESRWTGLGVDEYTLARATFFPDYSTLDQALDSPGDSLISRMYSVVRPEDGGSHYLFRRADCVGRFESKDLLKVYPEFPYTALFVRNNLKFKGEIVNADS